MSLSMIRIVRIGAWAAMLLMPLLAGAAGPAPSDGSDRTAAHVLNRVAFGARPGDLENVRAMGIDRYIDQQLHPERIPDGDIASRLAGLKTLTMSSREIADAYERPLEEFRRQRAASGRQDAPAAMQEPPQ